MYISIPKAYEKYVFVVEKLRMVDCMVSGQKYRKGWPWGLRGVKFRQMFLVLDSVELLRSFMLIQRSTFVYNNYYILRTSSKNKAYEMFRKHKGSKYFLEYKRLKNKIE